MTKVVITIDGPAAAGKGSLSKKISNYFNFYYMETGIYYRAFAAFAKNYKNDNIDVPFIISKIDRVSFEKYLKKNNDLYNPEITNLASKLAKLKEVRSFVLNMQKIILNTFDSKFNGILLEGRDCGTVIAPNADVKIFLTADIKIRAERRFNQFIEGGKNITYEEIYKDLQERDYQDKNRKHSPLKVAKDAIMVNNSEYNFDQTINIVKNIIFSRIPTLKSKI